MHDLLFDKYAGARLVRTSTAVQKKGEKKKGGFYFKFEYMVPCNNTCWDYEETSSHESQEGRFIVLIIWKVKVMLLVNELAFSI